MSLQVPFQAKTQSKKPVKPCSNCENLKPNSWASEGVRNGSFNCELDELGRAASKGCEICSFVQAVIHQLFTAEEQKKIDDLTLQFSTLSEGWSLNPFSKAPKDSEDTDGAIFANTKSSMLLLLGMRDDPKYANVISGRSYDIILQAGSPQLPWFQLRTTKPTAFFGNTGSKEAAQWAQSRMKECYASHSECRAIAQSRVSVKPHLPRRIIEIVGDCSVRLKEVVDERADYACLSHCWGSIKALITEAATLHQYLDSIPWEKLPKTFREAVTFLRHMDVRYIWIDSLCIIQDSEEDWLEHSGSMADIYSAACITIAATRAGDGSVGLFSDSQEMELTSGDTKLLICDRPKHAHPGNVTDESFPLLTRGWVAQEMLLSPRVLHFSNKELVYECMRGAICSCCTTEEHNHGCYGRKNAIWSRELKESFGLSTLKSVFGFSYGNKKANPSAQSRAEKEEEHFSEWRQMLMNYSDLELTFEKDRFPAISGLARCFATNFKTTYAAGLWIENIRNDLLWVMPHRLKPEQRRTAAGAPTWSWANCGSDTTSYMCPEGSQLYFTFIASHCVPRSEYDTYGQLKSAVLTLKAHLIPLVLTRSKKGYNAQYDGRSGIEIEPDLNLASILADANERGLFFGVPIVQLEFETRGLALHRLEDGQFERVGLWFCSSMKAYYHQFDPPENWRAEALHEVFEMSEAEIIGIV